MRLRSALLAVLLAVAPALLPAPGTARSPYPAESDVPAASTCPADTVVWANTRSGVYHMPGMTWFGHTREGKFMCRKDADRAGYRATKNGQ